MQPLVHMVSDEEAKGKAKELFDQLIASSGKVPKWVRVMANCDDILVGFFTMFKATMDDAPVDKILKWKVAHKVSTMNECEFCVDVAHTQLKQFGLSDEDIKQIEVLADDKTKAALQYGAAVTKEAYAVPEDIFAELKKHFNDAQIVELTAVIGLFNYINRFNDALGVLPD